MQPAVARFLGARNVMRARRDPRDHRVALLADGGSLRTADELPGEAVLVVRPEDVRLAPATPGGSLTATVTRLTLQGGHVLVRLEVPAALDALVPAAEVERLGLAVGLRVAVSVRPTDVHVLPAG